MRRLIIAGLALGIMSGGTRADCSADFQQVVERYLAAGPYRAEISVEAAGQTMKFTGEIILPDRFHMHMPQGEMIKTVEGMWMKMGGKWLAMPAGAAAAMQSPIDQSIAQGMKNIENLACLGTQAFKNQVLIVFVFDSKGKTGGVQGAAHTVMYADSATLLPVWLVIRDQTKGREGLIIQHLTFDSGITISPPQ